MIIYGTKTRSKELWTGVLPCPHCERNTWHVAAEYSKWFSLFFIPLIPYKRHFIFTCRACGYPFELKPEYEARFRDLLAGRPVARTEIVEEMASSAEPMVTQPEVKPVPHRRRKEWLWTCVVIVSVILVATVAFAIHNNSTDTGQVPIATEQVLTGWAEYSNDSLGFSAYIPEGWEAEEHSPVPGDLARGVSFAAEPEAMGPEAIVISVIATPLLDLAETPRARLVAELKPSAERWLASRVAEVEKMRVIKPVAETEVGGHPAVAMVYEDDAVDGSYSVRGYAAFLCAHDWLYFLEVAGIAQYDALVQSTYETFLEGFRSTAQ